ncbi:MAG: pentapeptide repeat-containing protein [Hyphomicrobium sp.]|uniref:pentapeptide repeat-containing protein n=1 Tax=Hyphomicrobium sp. TaxID=82 RepID=UPI003D0C2502
MEAAIKAAHGAPVDLSGKLLNRLDLSGFDLHGANLQAAKINGCNLAGADFTGTKVARADFDAADFASAHIGVWVGRDAVVKLDKARNMDRAYVK